MSDHNTVLVVDDDDDFRAMLALILEAKGYRALGASDGLDALSVLGHREPPSLILVDLRMPRMNGLELIAALHDDPAYADVPIVVMTGDLGGARSALAAGARAYLAKPIEPRVLVDAVARYAT